MFKLLLSVFLALCAAAAFAAVDVNKANQAELEAIKGIGPAMSGKILDERKKSDFKSWDDFIVRIKGVGPGNAGKFSEAGLTVNGAVFAAAAAVVKPAAVAKADKVAKDK
jgi:competence protein ComEA